MIDKLACERVIRRWALPLPKDRKGMSADRNVFSALRRYKWGESRAVTVFYQLNPKDGLHAHRMTRFKEAYEQAGRLDAPLPRLDSASIYEPAPTDRK